MFKKILEFLDFYKGSIIGALVALGVFIWIASPVEVKTSAGLVLYRFLMVMLIVIGSLIGGLSD